MTMALGGGGGLLLQKPCQDSRRRQGVGSRKVSGGCSKGVNGGGFVAPPFAPGLDLLQRYLASLCWIVVPLPSRSVLCLVGFGHEGA